MASAGVSQIGSALVEFSLHGLFPDEDVSSSRIEASHLSPALGSLAAAKLKLEVR